MRIAVVGAGIVGLVTAEKLSSKHRVTVFERESRIVPGASSANASLLMFKPDFTMYDFTPDLKSAFNVLVYWPEWGVKYLDQRWGGSKPRETAETALEQLSKMEFLARDLPRHSRVLTDGVPLIDTYILNCSDFAHRLVADAGFDLRLSCGVQRLLVDHRRVVGIELVDGTVEPVDLVVICAGSDPKLVRAPIIPVYGQSRTTPASNSDEEVRALIDTTTHTVTSFQPDENRVTFGAIVRTDADEARRELDEVELPDRYHTHHTGARPLTPHGLPMVSVDRTYPNLLYNIGHGFLGWTHSFGTAKLIEELVDEKRPSIDLSPERFSMKIQPRVFELSE